MIQLIQSLKDKLEDVENQKSRLLNLYMEKLENQRFIEE
jgi:hypothetical protein